MVDATEMRRIVHKRTPTQKSAAQQLVSVPLLLLGVLVIASLLDQPVRALESTERPVQRSASDDPKRRQLFVASDWQPAPSARLPSGQPIKPPRAYCLRASRAIRPDSRCFDHLLPKRPQPHASGTRQAPPPSDEAENRNHNHSLPGLRLTQSARDARARDELVYVRLETLGDSLENLSTQTINDRLLADILAKLFHGPEAAVPDDAAANRRRNVTGTRNSWLIENFTARGTNSTLEHEHKQLLDMVRRQLLDLAPSDASGGKCKMAIEKFLCRLIYPTCHFRRVDVSALVRPPCREDCLVLRDVFCPSLNWRQFVAVLEQIVSSTLKSFLNELDLISNGDQVAPIADHSLANASQVAVHFYWPHQRSMRNCESLPALWHHIRVDRADGDADHRHQNKSVNGPTMVHGHSINQFGDKNPAAKINHSGSHRRQYHYADHWPVCSNSHLTETLDANDEQRTSVAETARSNVTSVNAAGDIETEQDCWRHPNGIDYQGTRNYTKAGIPCQMWALQWPHKHKRSESMFNSMFGAHNYCRNPGGMESMPWCYTTDPSIRWQYCNIGPCKGAQTTQV